MLMGAGAKAAADAARATIAAADFMVRCGVYLCVAEVVLASLTVLNEENGFVLQTKVY